MDGKKCESAAFGSFRDVVAAEERGNVWSVRWKGYPLWTEVRPEVLPAYLRGTPVGWRRFSPLRAMAGLVGLVRFLHAKVPSEGRVFFLSARPDIRRLAPRLGIPADGWVFVNHDSHQGAVESNFLGIPCDLLLAIRWIFRKSYWLLERGACRSAEKAFLKVFPDPVAVRRGVRNSLGDAAFFETLLSVFPLLRRVEIVYSYAVVPAVAKLCADPGFRVSEVQHGLIHECHPSYAGLPRVSGRLLVTRSKYEGVLAEMGYEGPVETLASFPAAQGGASVNGTADRKFGLVFFTQPMTGYQRAIERLLRENPDIRDAAWIQRHPRDAFDYGIPAERYVLDVHRERIGTAVAYFSTVIDDLATRSEGRVLVWNVREIPEELFVGIMRTFQREAVAAFSFATDPGEVARLIRGFIQENTAAKVL